MANPSGKSRLARIISQIENDEGPDRAVLKAGYGRLSELRMIGLTGPPGAGKSSLVDGLVAGWAGRGLRAAVLAIDPSSPFSGGAMLGDRIRMHRAEAFDSVFIRSVAARGHPGGLAAAVPDICVALAAFGFDRVAIETVGAGQNDVAIKDQADSIVVVSVPGLGDSMQAIKAGTMEIGDVYVVNKADTPGADRTASDIRTVIELAHDSLDRSQGTDGGPARRARGAQILEARHGAGGGESCWRPPVVMATATEEGGAAELAAAIERHLAWSEASGRLHNRRIVMLRAQLQQRLAQALLGELGAAPYEEADQLAYWARRIAASEVLPEDAVKATLEAFRFSPSSPAGVERRKLSRVGRRKEQELEP